MATSPAAAPDRNFSTWLDLFRWIAALVVVWSHAGGRLLLRSDQVDHPSLVHLGYSFIAGYAHYAVMIFFVMSGYLVGGSAWAEQKRGKLDLKTYAAKRVVRLSIVLYPTLLLTAALVPLARFIWPGAFEGANTSPVTMACNAIYLQEALCTRYGGNDSLWSLFHEFWYYVAFPPILLGLTLSGPKRVALLSLSAVLLIILGAIQFHNVPILPYFAIWMLGFWVYTVPSGQVTLPTLPAAALFLGVLTAVRLARDLLGKHWALEFISDATVAVTFSMLLLSLKMRRTPAPPLPNLHKTMASFSYSLYCVHLPLISFYVACSMGLLGFGADMNGKSLAQWLVVAGGLGFSIAGAFALYWLTERHTDQVRRWLTRVSTRQKAPA